MVCRQAVLEVAVPAGGIAPCRHHIPQPGTCPLGASQVVKGRGKKAWRQAHQNGRHGPTTRHTRASTDVDSHGEIGERTGVLELLARSLVVPQFHGGKGLDDPFKNGIGRSCFTLDRVAY